MSDRADKKYKVGYGKPPREHQFKKGVSGNPYGRPRAAKNKRLKNSINPYVDAVLRAVDETVPVREDGKVQDMSVFDAALRNLGIRAARGEFRYLKLLLEIGEYAQKERLREVLGFMQSVDAYKSEWEPIFERARLNGQPEPYQLPHPAHVGICNETGMIEINGPDTPELKVVWDALKRALRAREDLLLEARKYAEEDPDNELWQTIVRAHEAMFRQLESQVLPGWNWREDIGDVAVRKGEQDRSG